MGNTTHFEYDERNRNTAVIDAIGQRTSYSYDIIGNLTSIKDANLHTTSYEYDALNRRTATIIPLGQRSTTSYNAIGNVTSSTDFNGQTIAYTYDVMNRLKTKQLGANNSVSYSYTATGLMSSTIDARGTTSYNYDQRDRLIKQTETDGQTLQYTYDKASNRTSVTTQAGTTNYGYDRYNELTTVTDKNGGVTTYTYDKAGNRTKIVMADGTVETRNYDLLNHLVKQETSNATGLIAGYTYTLDAGGKKVKLLENNGRQVNYAYDKLDRLLTEQITDGTNGNRTTGYVYDPIGNRLSKTDSVAGVTSYVYDNNDRLLTETNGSKITTSTYDNNGNNLTRGDGTSLTTNTWDIENRLVQSVTDASTTIYQYDPNGVRVSSKTNGVETRYLVDRNRPHASVMLEYNVNGNGNAIIDYTYGIGLISQQRGNVTAFYHADGLGSTRFLTDSVGNITDAYTYDAYGNTLSSSGTTVNNYLYTGEQFDRNLGEYYLRARYYSPGVGRFTGRDPFEGVLDVPLSLNKYGYVHGNPVNATDPTGMFLGSFADLFKTQEELIRQNAVQSSGVLSLTTRFLLRSVGRSVGIAGTTGLAVLGAHVVNLIMSKNALKNCNATGDQDCQAGVPIVFFGQNAGRRTLRETTEHIRYALQEKGLTPLLSTYTSRPGTHGPEGWQRSKPECRGRMRFPYRDYVFESRGTSLVNNQIVCDEYPFNQAIEGGRDNYERGLVSLRLTPKTEGDVQGALIDYSNLSRAGVVRGDFLYGWYGVVAITGLAQSFLKDRQGNKVIPSISL